MPVLEAGLVGCPVVCTDVPAAEELGGEDVMIFDPTLDPDQLAEQLLVLAQENPVHRLRRQVRQSYTWESIFHRDIKPLLQNRDMVQ